MAETRTKAENGHREQPRCVYRVVGLYYEQAVLREMIVADPEIAALHQAIAGLPEAATEDGRIGFGEAVTAAFAVRQERDSASIVEALRRHAAAVAVAEPIHGRMAANASFLVERAARGAFAGAVEAVRKREANRIR